jgi:multidrug efflux system membrane fusion protein
MNTAELEHSHVMEETVVAPEQTGASARAPSGASRWWVYVILAIVVGGFGYFIYHELQESKSSGTTGAKNRQVHDLPVVVDRVRRGDLDQYLVGLGTVTPLNTVTVKSRVDGAITKIWFTEGQKVKTGDPLIDIDPRPYEAALEQAQGQLKKDQAAEASANWNVQQDTIAIKDKAIAELQLHTDTATRDQALGAIDVDNAAIATAQLNITYSHITSPIDGTVGLRLVDVGNIVHATDTTGLVVIAQLQPITVIFTVPEDNIEQVQKRINSGQPVPVDAYDRDLTQKIASGKLLAIDNEIDPTTGTVKIKAEFDNKDNALYPSQFVNARMLVNTIKNAVLVPSAAIQHSPTSTFAYVVVPDTQAEKSQPAGAAQAGAAQAGAAQAGAAQAGTTQAGLGKAGPTTSGARAPMMVTMRQVVTGAIQPAIGSDSEDTTVVLSGLQPGDVVVTDGVDKLIEGTRVIPTFATHARRNSATMPTTQATTRGTATHDAAMPGMHHGHKPAAE